MKNQKGITLVALVITIIVMLILVGVSLTVAIQNGLIGNAQSDKNNTTKEQLKENNIANGWVTIKEENGTEKYTDIRSYSNDGQQNSGNGGNEETPVNTNTGGGE